MKIAVTSKGEELESEIDPRFGRCSFFIIVDPETMKFEALKNQSAMATGGAGPKASEAIFRAGAEVVLTGNVGPNAFQALDASGIKVVTGANGTVKEMVERFIKDEVIETESASVNTHSGM